MYKLLVRHSEMTDKTKINSIWNKRCDIFRDAVVVKRNVEM